MGINRIKKLALRIQESIPIYTVDSDRGIIFREEATLEQREQAQLMVDGWETLALTMTPEDGIILANTGEAAITCGLQNFDYVVYKGSEMVILRTSINDGVLEYSTPIAGDYLIEIISGNQTGFVEVKVING